MRVTGSLAPPSGVTSHATVRPATDLPLPEGASAADAMAGLEDIRRVAAARLHTARAARHRVLLAVAVGNASLEDYARVQQQVVADEALCADADALLVPLRLAVADEAKRSEIRDRALAQARQHAIEDRPDAYFRVVRDLLLASDYRAQRIASSAPAPEPVEPTAAALNTWLTFVRRGGAGEPRFVVTDIPALQAAFKRDPAAFCSASGMHGAIGASIRQQDVANPMVDKTPGAYVEARPGPWRTS